MKVFNTLKVIFWKKETFFKKLEYRFLIESMRIESRSFRYKTAISKTNVKTNVMVSTKRTYHKERSFASNYFIFFEILFQFKNQFNVPAAQTPIFVVFLSAGVLFDGAFTLWVSLKLSLEARGMYEIFSALVEERRIQ